MFFNVFLIKIKGISFSEDTIMGNCKIFEIPAYDSKIITNFFETP